MTFEGFVQSLQYATPPKGLNDILKALWYDAQGDWEKAHELAQKQEGTPTYDRIHAYLHRKEGDEWNARYWYNRIKIPFPQQSLLAEWEALVKTFLIDIKDGN